MAVNDADIDAFLDADDEQIDAFLDAPTDAPAAPAQQQRGPGLMEQITGPGLQMVEGALPFMKPAGEALGFAGKKATEGFKEIENLAIQNQGADSPQAMLAKGISGLAGIIFPQSKNQAYAFVAGEALAPEIPAIIKGARKELAGPVSRLMRATAGVPERYGKAAWLNPEILTNNNTIEAAKIIYKNAIGKLRGKIDFASAASGKLIPEVGDLKQIINSASEKVGVMEDVMTGDILPMPPSPKVPSPSDLQEVLTARQAVSHMLMTKDGMEKAMKRRLLIAKDSFDQYLEDGLPGFKDATKGYFEANAREAFSTWGPQNKNLSPNALRSMLALSRLSSGILTGSPWIMAEALPMSPRALGLGIRMGNQLFKLPEIYGAQFAARIAAMRGVGAVEGPK